MELRMVTLKEMQASIAASNKKDFELLSQNDLNMIKNNFKLENENRLLNCYRFQAPPKTPLYKFLKSLQQREIAYYCKEIGWTISNSLIIEAIK